MLSSGFESLVREQPLALVALGLAAGATVAALLPETAVEERALGSARDAISGMRVSCAKALSCRDRCGSPLDARSGGTRNGRV